MTTPTPLQPRLVASTLSTEDILVLAQQGQLRLPVFQRLWKWRKEHVRDLFDSLLRGFPVGTLLLWTRPAEEHAVRFGDDDFGVDLPGPASDGAQFIIDGQQRITSLVGTLLHPAEGQGTDIRDPFALHFDLIEKVFRHPERGGAVPPHWLSVWALGDTLRLLDWQGDYAAGSATREHIRSAHQTAKAIREYRWPVYIINHHDEDLVRTIFDRTNGAGIPLKADEIFQALYGARSGDDVDPGSLSSALRAHPLGAIPDDWLLKTLVALRHTDLTRIKDHLRQREQIHAALNTAQPLLERVLDFLARDVGVEHLQLLPYRMPIPVLARLFHDHDVLDVAQRRRLARWVWQGAVTGAHQGSTAVVRAALGAVDAAETLDEAIDALWAQVAPQSAQPLFERYDFRLATTKIGCNALLSLGPLDLEDGHPLDVAAVIEREGANAFRPIVRRRYLSDDVDVGTVELVSHLANRMCHPFEEGTAPWSVLLALAERQGDADLPDELIERLASHAITPDAFAALRTRDTARFLELRAEVLRPLVDAWIAARVEEDEPLSEPAAVEQA